jgi:hypothetical protein
MNLKFSEALKLIRAQMTPALLIQTAAAVLAALFGLVIVILLVLGASTAIAILYGFNIKYLGVAVSAFVLGGLAGGALVYGMIQRAVPQH